MVNYLFVVITQGETLGVFSSEAKARDAAQKYPALDFVVYRFPREGTQTEKQSVWFVMYQTYTIAYASDNRDKAIATQKMLARIGLVDEDDIDYTQLVLDEVREHVASKLKLLNDVSPAGATYSIFDAVCPVDLEGAGRADELGGRGAMASVESIDRKGKAKVVVGEK